MDLPKKHKVFRTQRSKPSLKKGVSKKKLSRTKNKRKPSPKKLKKKKSQKFRGNKTTKANKKVTGKRMRRNISDFKAKQIKKGKTSGKGFEIEMFVPEGSFDRMAYEAQEENTPENKV